MTQVSLQAIQPLFFSPLAVFDVADHVALNASLLPEIAARRMKSLGLNRSNRNGWHSEDDLFERKEPASRALSQHILEAVRICTKTVSPGFDFAQYGAQAEGWINVLGQGGLNTPHDHPAWVWSGTYYVSVPDGDDAQSGAIEFLDTRTNLRTLTVEGAACFASKFILKPRVGTIVVFPSYLRHWVYPNESSLERVSIAFNARFARLKQT
jgi:uncharacterized protein (TIGR02466 family)